MSSYVDNRENIIERAGEYFKEQGFKVVRHIQYDTITTESGYEVKTPAQYQPYDLVISKGGGESRVSVKIAIRGRGGRNTKVGTRDWRVTTWTKKEPPTFYLVWMPDHETFIDLPGSFFSGYKGYVRTIPQEHMTILKHMKRL